LKITLPWILAVLTGIIGFLGYIGFNLFFLEWIFLVPLLFAISNATPKRSFFIGWLAGTVGHAGGFYWFSYTLMTFVGVNLFLALVGLVLLAAFNGLFFAIFSWAIRRISLAKGWSFWWIAPILYTALENVYPFIFPNNIGASQYPLLAITQIAELTGILGISFLLIWFNSTIFIILDHHLKNLKFPVKKVGAFAIATLVISLFGVIRISQVEADVEKTAKINVAMIQAGLGEAIKFRDPWGFIALHQELSQAATTNGKVDLIIWPEAVVITPITRITKKIPESVLGNIAKPILFGAFTIEKTDGELKKYTSAILADGDRSLLGLYDKQILVPVGEYIPFGSIFPVLYNLFPYTTRFWPGKESTLMQFNTFKISVNICYEDLFFSFVRKNMHPDDELPHAIFNLTNDSWYGDTTEPLQHLVMASFRAIENRRALVRSTNTGISAIIDPTGKLNKRTGQWTQETLVGEVPMMTGQTFFNCAGNWFGWIVSLIALFLIGSTYKNASRNKT
jgi:apolipoprotein N-acyltransferase